MSLSSPPTSVTLSCRNNANHCSSSCYSPCDYRRCGRQRPAPQRKRRQRRRCGHPPASYLLLISMLLASATLPVGSTAAEDPMNYIIGGSVAAPRRRYEFMVQSADTACGGTLVWHDVVLSAGHCQRAFAGGAVIGAYKNIGGDDENDPNSERRVIPTTKRIVHPLYRKTMNRFDIMVVMLQNSSSIRPVQLNTDRSVPEPHQSLVALGFGRKRLQGKRPLFLQAGKVNQVPDWKCESLWDGIRSVQPASMICATQGPTTATWYVTVIAFSHFSSS